MSSRKIVTVFFLILILALSLAPACFGANSSCVNLYTVTKNESGDGYVWNNRESTLTLNNFEVYTEDDFGLKIPENAKVVLKGKSYIKAGKYGIGISSGAVFSGDGTLTVEASDSAFYIYGTNGNKKVRFDSGTYVISAGKYGINSEKESVSLTGCTMNIKVTDGFSVYCKDLIMKKSSFTSDAPVFAKEKIELVSSFIDINASSSALQSSGKITLSRMNITGKDGDLTEYSGENVLKTEALKDEMRRSIIFGEKYPILFDIIIFISVIVLVVLLIVIPVVHKRRKVRKMYNELNSQNS